MALTVGLNPVIELEAWNVVVHLNPTQLLVDGGMRSLENPKKLIQYYDVVKQISIINHESELTGIIHNITIYI